MITGVLQALELMLQCIVGFRTISIYNIWLNLCVIISLIMYFVSKLINEEIDYQNWNESIDNKNKFWRRRRDEKNNKN